MQDNRTHFDKLHALNSSVIGFEFEFFTNILKGKVAESLSKLLNKKIEVSEKYHSNKVVDASTFKLEPDYSGGNKMLELITGPLSYAEAIPILIKILKWIDENGWTTDRCAFQFSVSFDKNRRDIKDKIENLDKLKFVLGLDESFIYSKFGSRSKNVYAKSIKRVVPRNRFSILENITSIDPKMFKVPIDKYYGVNFTKLDNGYIEFRYLGNRDYQKKITDIREVIDYVLLYLYDLLSRRITGYNKEDVAKLQEMMKSYTKVVRAFSNVDYFFRHYPDFHVFVDLKGTDENIKTYFPVIKDKIFDLIVDGNIKECYFNYDTTTGRYQVKDARIREGLGISNMDIISCDIKNTILNNCNIYSSEIRKSSIEDSHIFSSCDIQSSKIKDTSVEYNTTLTDCFVDCNGKNINCKIEGGVIRAALIGPNSEISDKTQKVKGWQDPDKLKFINDRRLTDLNNIFKITKFGNKNN